MLSKVVFDKVLSSIKVGALEVDYWGSETKKYGQGKPYFKMTFRTPQAVTDIIKKFDLGFGEAYAAGDIEIDGDLTQVWRIINENAASFEKLARQMDKLGRKRNVKHLQADYIEHHYDVGNDFYSLWLDKDSMTYTCAYYKTPNDTLEQAQLQKIDHVLGKLQLEKGQTLLDIGCGWGHLVLRAAQKYGTKGLGVTLSKEQHAFAVAEAKKTGMEKLAQYELINYQDLIKRDIQFDRVVSVGVLEHVGFGNHRQYFDVVKKLLKPQGISLLHSITQQTEDKMSSWIDKYIFPGGYIPSMREITNFLPEYEFWLTDYENLRIHYAMTCAEWLRRFDLHKDEIIKMKGESFYRTWRLYLASSSASFRYSTISLSQWVFTNGRNNELPLTREHLYR